MKALSPLRAALSEEQLIEKAVRSLQASVDIKGKLIGSDMNGEPLLYCVTPGSATVW